MDFPAIRHVMISSSHGGSCDARAQGTAYRVVHNRDVVPHLSICCHDWRGKCTPGAEACPYQHSSEVRCCALKRSCVHQKSNPGSHFISRTQRGLGASCPDSWVIPSLLLKRIVRRRNSRFRGPAVSSVFFVFGFTSWADWITESQYVRSVVQGFQ